MQIYDILQFNQLVLENFYVKIKKPGKPGSNIFL